MTKKQTRKSNRIRQKPIRYRDSDHVNQDSLDSVDTNYNKRPNVTKVKRILAKRRNKGSFIYLVQMIGEPSQNAKWMSMSDLPPPLID